MANTVHSAFGTNPTGAGTEVRFIIEVNNVFPIWVGRLRNGPQDRQWMLIDSLDNPCLPLNAPDTYDYIFL